MRRVRKMVTVLSRIVNHNDILHAGEIMTSTLRKVKLLRGDTSDAAVLSARRSQLSGGMAQRLMIALAIGSGARVLLADEISSALDAEHEKQVFNLMCECVPSALFVTHRFNIAETYCTKALVLRRGMRVFFGTMQQLCEPALLNTTPVVREIIAPQATNAIDDNNAGANNTNDYNLVSVAANHEKKTHALLCDRVNFSYGTHANQAEVLRECTLRVPAGGITIVRGPTGCGKSTLAQICSGALYPDNGAVFVQNKAMCYGTSRRARIFRRAVQVVPQVPTLSFNPLRSVLFSLCDALIGGKHTTNNSAIHAEIKTLCSITEFDPAMLRRMPRELSGGQLQRAAVIRAMLVKPSVLILDEPVSHLDHRLRAAMLDFLCVLNREHGIALLLITHLPDVVRRVRRVYTMHHASRHNSASGGVVEYAMKQGTLHSHC